MKTRTMVWTALCLGLAAGAGAESPYLGEALERSYAAEAKGDLLAAVRPLKEIESMEGKSYVLQLRLGWLNYASGLFNESVDCYNRAARLAPDAVEPLIGLTLPLQAGAKHDEVIRVCQTVLKMDPGNYTALSRLAWAHYAKGEFNKAAEAYGRTAALYPSDVEMLLGLGYSRKLGGNPDEAAKIFRKALLLSPKNPRALAGLK